MRLQSVDRSEASVTDSASKEVFWYNFGRHKIHLIASVLWADVQWLDDHSSPQEVHILLVPQIVDDTVSCMPESGMYKHNYD